MKYKLQPYAGMQSRYRCPGCNHHTKSFVRYIDTQTGQQLPPHIGRCGRVDKCGYHVKPGSGSSGSGCGLPGAGKSGAGFGLPGSGNKPATRTSQHEPDNRQHEPGNRQHETGADYFINPDYVRLTLTAYKQNNFVQYLIMRLGRETTQQLIKRYHIGTHGHWPGATVFWQYDKNNWVRTGKIMLYNAETGKRVKEPFNHITWAHTVIAKQLQAQGQPEYFELKQCLFGEHLLAAEPNKPVGIVESEKTAIIASAILPQFIWLACGSLQGLNEAKCSVLKGRSVMLFPDVNAYDKWRLKSQELNRAMPDTMFMVSEVLERMATAADRMNGVDIGDVVSW